MTIRLYLLDVEEFRPIIETATDLADVVRRCLGDYVEIAADSPVVIDRRATGVRHAVWYSSVAALGDGRITQWDKDALRIEPAP
jgi:hypothetical protein